MEEMFCFYKKKTSKTKKLLKYPTAHYEPFASTLVLSHDFSEVYFCCSFVFSFLRCIFCFVCLDFVYCVQCCLCPWIVYSWLSVRFPLTFHCLIKKSKIPPYFKDQSVPIISYVYTRPIASKKKNYKHVLHDWGFQI